MIELTDLLLFRELSLFWGVVIAATILRAFTGFGFGLVAVPAFALFLTPAQSVILSTSLSLTVGIQSWPQYRGKIPLQPLLPMFLFAIAGTILGALLLMELSKEIFQMAIGVGVILACIVLTGYHPRQRQVHPVLIWGTGLTSGLMGGAFGMSGPPIIIYTMATEPDSERARAFTIMFLTFTSMIGLIIYSAADLVDMQSVYLFLLAYPAMYLGNKFGNRLFAQHGGRFYRQVALIALFFIGVSATSSGIFNLLAS
uniref:Probable membrane transporter protein n=1 Tax=Candidatus Kentrum sp. TUN TaxID=2126343 RepID=A0A450ZJL9_9GAMM|nr:MAG: hypothetical protein BECKTUN1418F_GA0071002_10347 [Candidatus Kentron sp. TUN]VFK55945.1 MAG: hypothetical protein BECKTUN1418E_GA0071001_10356 [Candidatus Kentron sp. TUN]